MAPWPTTDIRPDCRHNDDGQSSVSRQEIDTRFAEEHFGVADPELAQVPLLLGAENAGQLTESLSRMDRASGHWFAADYDKRIDRIREDPEASLQTFARMLVSLDKAQALLKKANPNTPAQKQRVDIWQWAHDVLRYYAEFGPQVLKEPGSHDPDELAAFRGRAELVMHRTDELLRPMMTDWTMVTEQQVRFGLHLDYLQKLTSAIVL